MCESFLQVLKDHKSFFKIDPSIFTAAGVCVARTLIEGAQSIYSKIAI